MSWKVRLRFNGDRVDLEKLSNLFGEREPTIGRDADGFYLQSSEFGA